jgi:hypothetical protein
MHDVVIFTFMTCIILTIVVCFVYCLSSLWAICVLIGNHPANVKRLLSCTSDNWTEHSVKKFLQDIKSNNGQTAEARDHASLICCSIDMFEKQKFSSSNTCGDTRSGHPHTAAAAGDSRPHSDNSSGAVSLTSTDREAAEFMQIFRTSKCTIADTISYDLSAFPALNSEPFFHFNIVGVQCVGGRVSAVNSTTTLKGVTEI